MKKIIKKLINSKFSWKVLKNKKIDIVLFDENYANLDLKKYRTFYYKKDTIYIYYLIRAFFYSIISKNKIKHSYFSLLLKDIDAKVAIGHDIETIIFDLKKYYPKIVTIVYQHGFYWPIHRQRSLKRFKNLKSDYLFIFNEWHKKIFSPIKTKYFVNESTKNNEIANYYPQTNKKKYDIMLISQFRFLDHDWVLPKNSDTYEQFTFENNALGMMYSDTLYFYMLKIINAYSIKYKKKICVALSSNRKEKNKRVIKEDEIKYFSQHLDNFYTEDSSSYELAKKSKLSICLSSNLGPELLSIGERVLFLNINTIINDWDFLADKNETGFCWYKGKNFKTIEEKINSLLTMSKKNFELNLSKSKIKLKYDPANKMIKNIISKHL